MISEEEEADEVLTLLAELVQVATHAVDARSRDLAFHFLSRSRSFGWKPTSLQLVRMRILCGVGRVG